MRIAIVANDTRGGIQPYVALGIGLRDAGHEVRVIAPEGFGSLFEATGVVHAPLSGDVEEFVRSAGAAGRGSRGAMQLARTELAARVTTWTAETLEASAGMDVLTGGVGGMVTGLAAAEKLGIPFVEAHLQPVGAPSGAYPGPLFTSMPRWLGSPGVRASHLLSDLALWMPFRSAMHAARRQVLGGDDTPRRRAPQLPILYGFSRHVVPVPARRDRERHVTGYWFLPMGSGWPADPALEAFLTRRGGPVVSIGFGSMADGEAEATTDLIGAAVRRVGARAVLLSGWGGFAPRADADLFVTDAVPHAWLFPRVAAVVHHGGAGTTGAALSAGVPSIVVPFAVDQPFWGSRVAALGVGPTPIPRRRLGVDRLAAAIEQALRDDLMRARAARLGELIGAEDGVSAAVSVYEALSARSAR
jgi:UDP:flavonoid glycosyltransferase YjiC (YdhE family)